ncbi:transketolase C-terminal domain-containing protein [Cryobacterium sp. SO2]|uniref:transketolase family protein n=1 Tax=Cryobacterium sp. SO2 TaxID=1897060 RepID=UPI00223D3BC5|nr:transketolase C-terminal domain-containing protein [Cryobacterium sp. SO2]WEO77303.1 transketolase C-terminal domain-containing protein [Cryobacterium sp. SO2]
MTAESLWDVVHRLAREDPSIVFVGSDLNPTLLAEMRTELPEQFMMEGIQEQHLIGMAAGMALEGAQPVVSTIATFLTRRCFEQVHIDIGLHGLPVVLLGTGPGVAYHFFGPTHCAVDDFALLRTIPGVTLISPGSMAEAAVLLEEALRTKRFAYIRVPRPDYAVPETNLAPRIGVPVTLREGCDVAILSTGALTPGAVEAAERLADEGLSVAVHHVHTIKPLDPDSVRAIVGAVPLVMTVEEHLRDGGLGSAVLEILADGGAGTDASGSWMPVPRVVRLGLPDRYVAGYGSWADAVAAAGLDADSIAAELRRAPVKARS